MVDARKSLGYEGLEESHVQLVDEGFEFTGQPRTPPRFWGKLIATMSKEEIERKQRLTYLK
ncbi:hypothetical protein KFU94_30630 [Chloroflexi bacterium TSY]|nr:hypothetical protein [Chloroflexi bacterium TSY]